MANKQYIVDRSLHWIAAFLILFILMNMGAQIHTVNYQIKGQILHRQEAIQLHALMAIGVFALVILRFIWERRFATHLKRQSPQGKLHARFVQTVHACFYLILSGLGITGLGMAFNAEVSIHLFGVQLSDVVNSDGRFYGQMLDIHLELITTLWWLIMLHFAGVIYARR
ncbi:hypothetical protein N474_23380 [Pseudoalteromonas luteoviolacea CPMOR-2]|uniref:Cytochrome b561 bacterial/Ni-hydrogenase domain-containing protein n=1 Tax=Pseudoalteromonas luteoviolacea DSM 6061 TaxID=1365250 RepID=A0A166Z922_9GAMM|nr:cytochrome b/b6 domain-containing protein [Pseudoalteromonas luteoviolacea]KZN44070.1 hypothetical protein N475_08150 [Pseudoalteromonas luteoviolacea DSM 6061]KZN52160.1 hypothetical protein N474_23380 [Pseudoalteromonas luteoviolacea CPMOR-2]MBE0386183.1 hypothetical protein [Pseudoalteromonas luteoviolacea DSM 6061]